MIKKYQQLAVSSAVKTFADLSPPTNFSHALLQAETGVLRYTLDGSTNPTTSSGMILQLNVEPTLVLADDLRNLKIIRNSTVDGTLNVHYVA